jgi:hypothetical protein
MAKKANTLYLAITYVGVVSVDVTDPYHPAFGGMAHLNNTNDSANDITIAGNTALVATSGWGLSLVDISTPLSPTYLTHYDTPGSSTSVTTAGNFAYVGEGISNQLYPPDVQIIDISDPRNPHLALALDAPDTVARILVFGSSLLELIDHSTDPDELIYRRACGQ